MNEASGQVIKHITDKQGILGKDVYIFFFFRRGSYKLSYSWNNFLLEGEVIILNKTVLLPNAFIWKAERLINNTNRYRQTLLCFRQTYDRERIS